jgi:hypothetical protein
MGQYLALGITTKLTVSKEEAAEVKISLDEVLQKMQQTLHFSSDIYDFSEEKGYWSWTLKKAIWEDELLNFLKTIYPLLYLDKGYEDYEEVLEKLSQYEASSWLEIAEGKSFSSFQIDHYGEDERLYFNDKPFRPKIKVSLESVALAMEGKIMMEVYGGFFNFFKLCIQKAFPDYQISKAIRVYITG